MLCGPRAAAELLGSRDAQRAFCCSSCSWHLVLAWGCSSLAKLCCREKWSCIWSFELTRALLLPSANRRHSCCTANTSSSLSQARFGTDTSARDQQSCPGMPQAGLKQSTWLCHLIWSHWWHLLELPVCCLSNFGRALWTHHSRQPWSGLEIRSPEPCACSGWGSRVSVDLSPVLLAENVTALYSL